MPVRKHFCLLTCLAFSLVGVAQGNGNNDGFTPATGKAVGQSAHQAQDSRTSLNHLSFYFRQGQNDATLEQTLVFSSEQDELDYWKDQRAYERALLDKDIQEFTTYILAKQLVYSAHKHSSTKACAHGDYFHLRASYYAQFVSEDAEVLVWLQGFNRDNSLAGVSRN
ncbi:hypothetical protein SAMN04490243_0852 [Robiginitalea myxolifaciens]|uniref:Uncharacterized protein n=1 Tax=Robiginitalea myxolifaciens TaxID=400055 RepID=A0A1I6FXE7_9FLAO|nr:hypothetical protein [Robiginitalea myxolifaciens]SFR34571.1 hypothetical protein SAMN04490243_0852 [Robiginitalea myxolifaciens]